MLKFLSICSGIEAASVAFAPLGWEALAFAEIEPFPCAVLAHHYPQVPNLGDLTKWRTWPAALLVQVELLCGYTLLPAKGGRLRKGTDLAQTIAYLRDLGMDEPTATQCAHSPDGPRYKALGNSWAVPCARWIAQRIANHLAQ